MADVSEMVMAAGGGGTAGVAAAIFFFKKWMADSEAAIRDAAKKIEDAAKEIGGLSRQMGIMEAVIAQMKADRDEAHERFENSITDLNRRVQDNSNVLAAIAPRRKR